MSSRTPLVICNYSHIYNHLTNLILDFNVLKYMYFNVFIQLSINEISPKSLYRDFRTLSSESFNIVALDPVNPLTLYMQFSMSSLLKKKKKIISLFVFFLLS